MRHVIILPVKLFQRRIAAEPDEPRHHTTPPRHQVAYNTIDISVCRASTARRSPHRKRHSPRRKRSSPRQELGLRPVIRTRCTTTATRALRRCARTCTPYRRDEGSCSRAHHRDWFRCARFLRGHSLHYRSEWAPRGDWFLIVDAFRTACPRTQTARHFHEAAAQSVSAVQEEEQVSNHVGG